MLSENKKRTSFSGGPFFDKRLVVAARAGFSLFFVELNPFVVSFAVIANCTLRAFGNANTAVNAGVRINNQLSFSFVKSANRANVCASFAFYARIINNRYHKLSPLS